MGRTGTFLAFVATLYMLSFGAAAHEAQSLVRATASEVLAELQGNDAFYAGNPEALESMMRRVVVPRFDMDRIARWVLGDAWKGATEQQRTEFRDAFTTLLLRTYATALRQFDTREGLTYLPVEPSKSGAWVTVPTRVEAGSGQSIAIDYRVGQVDELWRVLDVKIEGISLVRTYRQEYAGVIEQRGVGGLIALLEERNRSARATN